MKWWEILAVVVLVAGGITGTYAAGYSAGKETELNAWHTATANALTIANKQATVQAGIDQAGDMGVAKSIETDTTTFDSLKGGAYVLPLLNPIPAASSAGSPIPFTPAFRLCWNAASSDTASPACEAGGVHAEVPARAVAAPGQLRGAAQGPAGSPAGAGPRR